MTILFTGDYLPDYNRTLIIKSGLKKLGHNVIEYPFAKKSRITRRKIIDLAKSCDFIFMPAFTHREVKFVRRAVGDIKIIFDPLISRYLTKVYDYKLVSPYGLSALRNYYRDKTPMQSADYVITDTKAHLEYFHSTFGIEKSKMSPIYIGNDFDQFYPDAPKQASSGKFTVGFYGGFIPLQGVMHILEAAQIIKSEPDVQFRLIGSGFEFEKAKNYVSQNRLLNVELPGWLGYETLRGEINSFDIALGVFGDTKKAELVIPNKLFHYAGCGRPIITKDTPAIREIFDGHKDLHLVAGTSESIAEAILTLRDNSALRQSLGQNIFEKTKANFDAVKIAESLIGVAGRLLSPS